MAQKLAGGNPGGMANKVGDKGTRGGRGGGGTGGTSGGKGRSGSKIEKAPAHDAPEPSPMLPSRDGSFWRSQSAPSVLSGFAHGPSAS